MQNGLSPNPNTWTPKAHTSLRGTPKQAEKSKSKRKKILLFLLCSFLWMNWCLCIMNWLRHDLLAELPRNSSLTWIELQPMCQRHNSCRRQFTKARLSIHATARLQFTRVLSLTENTLNLPIFYYALFIMLTFRKSKSKRIQFLLFLLCSFLWMNWCWRIMNWLRHDFSLRSMNWIATNVP